MNQAKSARGRSSGARTRSGRCAPPAAGQVKSVTCRGRGGRRRHGGDPLAARTGRVRAGARGGRGRARCARVVLPPGERTPARRLARARRRLARAADGLKRRLGSYQDAAWSPHGLYLVASRANELAAVTTAGDVRWSLARRDVRYPTWEGTRTDTRIAYIADSGLRVVAGDGTGDHLLDRYAQDVPPAWEPGRLHLLAYFAGGAVVLRSAGGPIVWRAPVQVLPNRLEWSSDGRELAIVSAQRIVVVGSNGRVVRTISMLGATFLQAAFRPGSHRLAVAVQLRGHSQVKLVDVDQPGQVETALRRAGRLPRPRLVAERRLAARQLADRQPVGLPARLARAGGREHPRTVPPLRPPRPGARTGGPLVLQQLVSKPCSRSVTDSPQQPCSSARAGR